MLKRARLVLLATFMLSVAAWAAQDPMIGEWKLNPGKSRMTDEMIVASLGGNKYSFDFGGGQPEVAVADGTDQPGSFGITIGVIVDGPEKWTVVRKKEGKMLVTGVWTLSKDGSTLNDHFTSVRPNGETSTRDYVYKRTGGGSGFVGDWVSSSDQMGSAYILKVQAFEGDGLSFITPGGGGTKNVKFDGSDYANVGAIVDGMAASARRLGERKVEVTDKLQGKVRETEEIEVADDGNTLTITAHIPGRTASDVLVFEKR